MTRLDPAGAQKHAFRSQALALLGCGSGTGWQRNAACCVHHPVPGDIRRTLGKCAADQPRGAPQPGTPGHLAVTHDAPPWNRGNNSINPLITFSGRTHGDSVAG